MSKIIIAIDGFSGTGKSSTAKIVAAHLGYAYIDTGAMYRAVTLFFLDNNIDFDNEETVLTALGNVNVIFRHNVATNKTETYLNDVCVEADIRGMRVSSKVSLIAAIPAVRNLMVSLQQEMGNRKAIVMDGRDVGTVIFPQAELKVFLETDVIVRAKRRLMELQEAGQKVELEEIVDNMKERDHIDSTRKTNPLRKADDAIAIDTSRLDFDEQVQMIIDLAEPIISR